MNSFFHRIASLVRNHPVATLAAIAAIFAAAQLATFDMSRHWEWDEAVYVSQVSTRADALPFTATRARGVTYLVAPIVRLTDSIPVLRVTLALFSSGALFLAFRVWIRISPAATLAGALLFGTTWTALFYGSEVSPNLYSALCAVAIAGLAVRAVGGATDLGHLAGLAAVTALAGLFRMYDMTLVAAGVAMGTLVAIAMTDGARIATLLQPRVRRTLLALAIGSAAGWLPWLIENTIRFGGPLDAFRAAVGDPSVGTSGWGFHLLSHLGVTDGPIFTRRRLPIPLGGVIWWSSWVLLAAVGTGVCRAIDRMAAWITLIAGAVAVAGYLFISPFAPRFLAPGYGLLAIGAGFALVEISRRAMAHRRLLPLAAGAWAILAAVAAWHVATSLDVAASEYERRDRNQAMALTLEQTVAGRPCAFWSQVAHPQIQLETGCIGRPLDIRAGSTTRGMRRTADEIGAVYFLTVRNPPRDSFLRDLASTPIPSPPGEEWLVFVLEGGG